MRLLLSCLLRGGRTVCPTQTSVAPAQGNAEALAVLERVADWQLANPGKHRLTDWTQSALFAGMMALDQTSSSPRFRAAMERIGETNQWELGPRNDHADNHAVGQTCVELWQRAKDAKMIAPLRARFDAILASPRDFPSLEFKQKGIGALWSWCDALFMAPPAWIRLWAATGDQRYLDFAVTNGWRTSAYLYDPTEHLYYRDRTYFTQREANGAKVFWGRGNGGVIGGLVRVLQDLAKDHPSRGRFETQFKEIAAKVLTCQQPDGLWRASLLDLASFLCRKPAAPVSTPRPSRGASTPAASIARPPPPPCARPGPPSLAASLPTANSPTCSPSPPIRRNSPPTPRKSTASGPSSSPAAKSTG